MFEKKTVVVPCRKEDPAAYSAPKYDNNEPWNVPGGVAPNGVSSTRYLRQTAPDPQKLQPLAAFLFTNAPTSVAGTMPSFELRDRVRCFNGLTEAGQIRRDAELLRVCNGTRYALAETAMARAESVIEMYGQLLERPMVIDWLFSLIEPHQSDEAYWNVAANHIIAAGVTRIEVGGFHYDIPQS